MSKRSPPANPPAVLMKTPESPSSSGEGKRKRKEPASCKVPQHVAPFRTCTSSRTAPRARLPSNIEDVTDTSLLIRLPKITFGLQRHLATDLTRIEIGAVASVFHRSTIHNRETVAEF